MEKTPFQIRCNIRMTALDMTQTELGELVGQPQAKIAQALRGDKNTAVSSLRVTIDQTLTRLAGEKRMKMAEDIRRAAAVQAPHLTGELSVILPEDVMYIVTEDGVPVGLWRPETKSYTEFPPTLGM